MNRNAVIAALTAGALLAPAAAAAAKKPEPAKGKANAEQVKAKGKAKPKKAKKGKKVKTVTYTLTGVYQGEGAVLVKRGNSAVRKARLGDDVLTLDWSAAKITVNDVDGDGVAGILDVQVGDRVLVQFRAPRVLDEATTYKARKLVDQTNPPVEDDEDLAGEQETAEDENLDVPADDAGLGGEPIAEDLPQDGASAGGE